MIALTCRVSLALRRVFSFGFEAWKQLCREFEPWVSSRFQWTLQAPLPSTITDSPVREIQRLSGDRTSENVELAVLQKYLCNGELAHRPDLQSGSLTTMCNLACDETTELTKAGQTRAVSGVVERADLSPRGKGEGGKKSQDLGKGVKTEKPKECFCCVTSCHSKSEYKNVSAAVKQKFAQRGRTNRHANAAVDSESDERRCSRGTSMASLAHELGVCFLHGGVDDPDEYLLPLPVIKEGDDDCTRQMRSDVSAAKQVDPSAIKPDVQIKPPEEVPVGSKFLNMSDGAQAVGGRLGVRCVAEDQR